MPPSKLSIMEISMKNPIQKTIKIALSTLILSLISGASWADKQNIEGIWQTIDDESGEVKSLIELKIINNRLSGSILDILDKDVNRDAKCTECEGKLKNKPIIGLNILNGHQWDRSDQRWVDGDIIDPANGKSYSSWLEVAKDNQRLDIRGFIGFSWAGRTQTWIRVPIEQDFNE
jgi:uncharacterized protein (DUF2147 family)